MTTKQNAIDYINFIACAIKIAHDTGLASNVENTAIYNYLKYERELKDKLDTIWIKSQNNESLFTYINNIIEEINQITSADIQYVKAVELCKWLDNKITYEENETNEHNERIRFSLSALISFKANQNTVIMHLNDNLADSNIWVNPKFETFPIINSADHERKKQRICNRDAFEGLNNDLHNISYFVYNSDSKYIVQNIILDPSRYKKQDYLKIFFAPMSDNKDLLQAESISIIRQNQKRNGISILGLNNSDVLDKRFVNDWNLAKENDADIFFAAEMLGTDYMYKTEEGENYNSLILNFSEENYDSKIPQLTMLPSKWKSRHNTIDIIEEGGHIIAKYEKNIPFVDKNNHIEEALAEHDSTNILVFHIPGFHRISIMICAEFISPTKPELKEFICKHTQPTLLLIPSYSRGERDFLNDVQGLAKYGVTVIWGNCCGAIRGFSQKIGAVKPSFSDTGLLFKNFCKCNNSCKKVAACGYMIGIPLLIDIGNPDCNITINHVISNN